MAGDALGAIRIDVDANVVQFIKNIQKGTASIESMGQKALATVATMDSIFKGLGSKMSLYVTAPILGIATAAVRAADPANKLGQDMERAGLRMQKAIAPVGTVLVEHLNRLKPTIDRAIDTVNGLAKKFAELEPQTQKNALQFAAIAAAAGPALLALSGITGATKALGSGFGLLYGAAKGVPTLLGAVSLASTRTTQELRKATDAGAKLAISLSLISKAALTATAATAGFLTGKWAYETFRPLQEGMAKFIAFEKDGLADLETAFIATFTVIRHGFYELVASLKPPQGLMDFVKAMANVAAPGSGNVLQAWSVTPPQMSMGQDLAKVIAQNQEAHAQVAESLRIQMADIASSFKGASVKTDVPFFQPITDGADELRGKIEQLVNGIKLFADEAQQAGQGASQAMVMTSDEAEKLKQGLAKAKDLRFAVYPREKMDEDIDNLRQLAKQFPEVLTPDVVGRTIERWEEDLKKLEEKAKDTFGSKLAGSIKNFSENVSDAWADMLVDGKAAFDELAKSFEKMIISMTLKQYAFEPIFGAIGGVVGSAFSGGTTSPRSDLGSQAGPSIYESQIDLSKALRSGNSGVVVNVYDKSGGVQVRQRQEGGATILDVLVPGMQEAFASGKMDRTMAAKYGIKPQPRY